MGTGTEEEGRAEMIWLKFVIRNPWHKSNRKMQKDYVCKDWKLSENKSFELQITKWNSMSEFFTFELDTCWFGMDHAGPEIHVSVLGYAFIAKLYDHRHWNWEEGRFQTLEEAIAEEEKWAHK